MKSPHRSFAGAVALGLLSLSLAGCGTGSTPFGTAGLGSGNTDFVPASTVGSTGSERALEFRSDGVSSRHINVIFKGRSTSATMNTLELKFGIKFDRNLPQINAASALIPMGSNPESVIARLQSDPRIQTAELSHRVILDVVRRGGTVRAITPFNPPPAFQVNDPMFGQQYGMAKISAPQAWSVTQGSPEVKIAMIDTGVDLNHPDLKDKLVPGMNIPNKKEPPMDDDGHGSHTAGIAGAAVNNGIGVTGVAAKVSIMPVKVLTNGYGNEADIAEGVIWAADHGADVASMSLGLYSRSEVLEKALQYALDHNVVLTASAGNRGTANDPVNAPHLPSTYPGVIEVAASNQNDEKADFSNFGNTLSVGAPGEDILSTVLNGYEVMSGTSMAAPHAAGLAGLVRSQHPKMPQAQVKKLIEEAADKLGRTSFDPNRFGWGRINAYQAVLVNTKRR